MWAVQIGRGARCVQGGTGGLEGGSRLPWRRAWLLVLIGLATAVGLAGARAMGDHSSVVGSVRDVPIESPLCTDPGPGTLGGSPWLRGEGPPDRADEDDGAVRPDCGHSEPWRYHVP